MVGQSDTREDRVAKRAQGFEEGRVDHHEVVVQVELPSHQARQLQWQLRVQSRSPLIIRTKDATVVQLESPRREHRRELVAGVGLQPKELGQARLVALHALEFLGAQGQHDCGGLL